jgi:hypothetical protein
MTTATLSDANRLGLDYAAEAGNFAATYPGPILDVHTHLGDADAARAWARAADAYGITRVWTMSPLEEVDAIGDVLGERVSFIAVPNHAARDQPDAFTTDWLRRIERFRDKGATVVKFWAAPRGRDLAHGSDALRLDSPIRWQGMKLAHDLGYRVFMTHVADPDTWFATRYADAAKYGRKREHFEPLERALAAYRDVTWIGAHMGGSPEDLDFLQGMLDRHPNYVVDTSATKWMVRELSKHPDLFRGFCERNLGRVLFGSDIVASRDNADDAPGHGFELYASRYWALRTLLETDYRGPSPIVDPDLHEVDPTVPKDATPPLHGAALPPHVLTSVYHAAAARVFASA